jgi:hypothetical protein
MAITSEPVMIAAISTNFSINNPKSTANNNIYLFLLKHLSVYTSSSANH